MADHLQWSAKMNRRMKNFERISFLSFVYQCPTIHTRCNLSILLPKMYYGQTVNALRPMGGVSLDIWIRWLSSRISEIGFPCFPMLRSRAASSIVYLNSIDVMSGMHLHGD
jgi:hypothetical protein